LLRASSIWANAATTRSSVRLAKIDVDLAIAFELPLVEPPTERGEPGRFDAVGMSNSSTHELRAE
jgi:hypothetical protein